MLRRLGQFIPMEPLAQGRVGCSEAIRFVGSIRAFMFRTVDGTLTLEPREGDRVLGFHYSVVTWTPQPNPRGTKVGEITIDWAKEKAPLSEPPSDVNEAVVAAIL